MDEETVEKVPAKKERPVFSGFNPTFKGYSKLPNEWLDEITSQIDNVAELKIVLYVYRHTWGFQEKKNSPDEPDKHDEMKQITTDEFACGRKRKDGTRMDNGTKLGLTAVKDGVARAIKHGYIICEIDDTDKARIKKSYGLKMQKSDSRNPTTDSHNTTSNDRNAASDKPDSDQRSEKDTRERNQLNESKKESEHPNVVEENPTSSSPEHFSHSFIHSSFTLSSECLEKVKHFTELYGDTDVDACLLEAEQIYQLSGKSDNDFYNALIGARGTLFGKNRNMKSFFRQLRRILKIE